MTLLSVINGSTYLKKDNSLRKRSKCVKITRYIEQTLGKKSTVFWRTPCAKMYTWGCMRVVPIIALVGLLRGRRLHEFVSLGGSQRPCTAAPQLCTLCVHAVLANLVNSGGSAKLRGRCLRVGVVSRDERRFTWWSQSWPRIVVGLVAAGEVLEHR